VKVLPIFDLLWKNVDKGDGEEDASSKRVGNAEDLGALTASSGPSRDEASQERFKENEDHEA
jgi:hypothetical protein